MRKRCLIPCLVATVLAAGCAATPRQTIELSDTIGRDLGEVHAANRQLANLYFDRLLADVDRFVDERYRPYLVERTLRELDLLASLRAAMDGEGELDPLDVLGIYAEETVAALDSFRTALRSPVESQRAEVLARFDTAFGRLQAGNAALTGYLASAHEASGARDALLADLGMEGLADRMAADLAAASAGIEGLLADGRRLDAGLEELPARLGRILGRRTTGP